MNKRDIEPIHPGEILLEDFMRPLGLSQFALAKAISVSPRRINEIVHGKRAITADTGPGTDAQSWLNLAITSRMRKLSSDAGRRGESARGLSCVVRTSGVAQRFANPTSRCPCGYSGYGRFRRSGLSPTVLRVGWDCWITLR